MIFNINAQICWRIRKQCIWKDHPKNENIHNIGENLPQQSTIKFKPKSGNNNSNNSIHKPINKEEIEKAIAKLPNSNISPQSNTKIKTKTNQKNEHVANNLYTKEERESMWNKCFSVQ